MPDRTSSEGPGLVDLTGLALDDLDASHESCLADVLRSVLSAAAAGQEAIAGFGNFI